jgi:hypothetical protein
MRTSSCLANARRFLSEDYEPSDPTSELDIQGITKRAAERSDRESQGFHTVLQKAPTYDMLHSQIDALRLDLTCHLWAFRDNISQNSPVLFVYFAPSPPCVNW